MPKNNAVWGIDIGQCSLKALRCEPHDSDPSLIVPTDFDYIEYPKILSQPEADPAQLVKEALEQFLSRNSVRADRVAISVSGQSGLSRFIKLPPVESKKIPQIVHYEAKQQIPFSLNDVIWDYQTMAGGSVDEGFALETEVGLFAMKRDQVYRALKPLDEVGVEVDVIQLTPLAIYNALVYDILQDMPSAEEYDPENPPESLVILSMGTDNTDLVVTNGFRVWQRNIPLGGSHFTRALSKELKLTFAKAEHLKRNAAEADDPKAVFQAMRPVFNDLLTETQRSLAYFNSIDRNAKLGRFVGLGNALKLPGLQRYLSQNLGHEVELLGEYRGLTGPTVTAAPAFKGNLLSFAPCYGLCLQGLNQSKVHTNLVPTELLRDRIIRDKKPFAVAAVALLLVACTMNFLGHWSPWNTAHASNYQQVFATADQAKRTSDEYIAKFNDIDADHNTFEKVSANLVSNVEGRLLWPELLKAISDVLPHDPPDRKPEEIGERRELHITTIDCQPFDDVGQWYTGIAELYKSGKKPVNPDEDLAEPAAAEPAAAPIAPPPLPGAGPAGPGMPAPGGPPGAAAPAAPLDPSLTGGITGPGVIVEIRGMHYFNRDRLTQGATFVRETLLKNLEEGTAQLPDANGKLVAVKMKDLGISYPVLVSISRVEEVPITPPDAVPDGFSPAGAPAIGPAAPVVGPEGAAPAAKDPTKKANVEKQFSFVVQFCWQPVTPSQRAKKAKEAQEAATAAAGQSGEPGADGPPATTSPAPAGTLPAGGAVPGASPKP